MIPNSNVVLGNFGEHLVLNRLRNLGRAKRQTLSHCGDLSFNGANVEVKTSKIGKVNANKQGWQFCLRRDKHTDISHSDYVILVGLNEYHEVDCVYVIPASVLGESRRKINIVKDSPSKWGYWLNRWDILEVQ